ncbi:hypothetical protein [Mycetocola sp.]|uniref:hypothetical protein n=1 Tax=Mycetocola sp. TaxID=1871042 RepID=UPI0039895F8A
MSEDATGAREEDLERLPQGWTRLGPHHWTTPFVVRVGSVSFAVCSFVVVVALQFLQDLPWPRAVVPVLILLAGLAASGLLFVTVRFPQPWVNFDTGEIRTGRRTASLAEIDSAWLFATTSQNTRMLTFRFGVAKGPQVMVWLRDRKGRLLDPETTRLIVAVLKRSNVRMPVSKDDPTGRFARYNFPGQLTLDAAIAVVESPPGPKDPLPVVSPV